MNSSALRNKDGSIHIICVSDFYLLFYFTHTHSNENTKAAVINISKSKISLRQTQRELILLLLLAFQCFIVWVPFIMSFSTLLNFFAVFMFSCHVK